MIFAFFDLLRVHPLQAVVLFSSIVTALLIGISFHEFSHAFVADRLGDGLPRRMGRVTLNPLAHLDPAGTILMLMVGFGWGKPVPVNPNSTRNPKAALGITAVAGPFSNFALAAAAGLPVNLGLVKWTSPFLLLNYHTASQYIGLYFSSIVLFSVILGVFNLIPIAPLDGFKVAVGFLPHELSIAFARLEQYGPPVLIGLIVFSFLTGQFVLFDAIEPIIKVLVKLFAGPTGDIIPTDRL